MKPKHGSIQRPEIKTATRERGRWLVLFRYFIVAFLCIAIFVMVPLLLVWKQVYITNASIRHHELNDSLVVLQKEVVALNIRAEKLSRTERIEQIARESLGLEYPVSQEIVIIRPGKAKVAEKRFTIDTPLWTVLKKSMTQVKG